MIFHFVAENEYDVEVATRLVETLDTAKHPSQLKSLDADDAETFLNLIHRPPHLLTPEDMVFCQDVVVRLVEAANSRRHVSATLMPSIDISDQDGLHLYWIPSARENTTLRF